MCMSSFTPTIEPGTLPSGQRQHDLARAPCPFFRCTMLAGILVKKLKSASEPTAMIAGTLKPKIRMGSSRTPPPTPVRPIRMPTTKPIRILSGDQFHSAVQS